MKTLSCTLLGGFWLALAVASWAAADSQKPQEKPAGKQRPGVRPGEVNTPPAKGERHRDNLKVGDPAPDFTLPDPENKTQTKLSSFQGTKPVVLIFGSFT